MIFTKKFKSDQENKKFVEATYKSCIAVQPVVSSKEIKNDNEQPLSNQIKQKNNVKTEEQFFYLSSELEN